MYRDSEMTIWFASGVGAVALRRGRCCASRWPVLLVIARAGAVRLALGQPADAELQDRYEQPLRPRRASRRASSRARATAARVFFLDSDTRATAASGRNVFISPSQTAARDRSPRRAAAASRPIGDDRFLRARQRPAQRRSNAATARRRCALRELPRRWSASALDASPDAAAARRAPPSTLLREPTPRNQGELAWRLGLVLGRRQHAAARHRPVGVEPARAPATGTCCSRCSPSSSTTTSSTWRRPGSARGRLGLGAALLALHGGVLAARRCSGGASGTTTGACRRAAAPPRRARPHAHEDGPPPVLRRHRCVRRLRRRSPSCRCSSSSTSSTSCRTSASGGCTGCTQALALRRAADARPPLRAAADRGADRHHLRAGAAGADLGVHDPAHRRPRARGGRCAAAGAGRWSSACSPSSSATTWRRSADRTAQLLQGALPGRLKLGRTGAWLKEQRSGERTPTRSTSASTARDGALRDVRIFEFDADGRLLSRTQRGRGQRRRRRRLDAGRRRASRAGRRTRGADSARVERRKLPTLRWPSTLTPEVVSAAVLPVATDVARSSCSRYIGHLDDNEQTAQRYEIQFWRRCSTRSPAW